jgi:hypothetical protein
LGDVVVWFIGCLAVVFVEVIFEFIGLRVVIVAHAQLELAFFRAQDDRLAFHAPDHVERSAGLAPQRHLQEVVLDAFLNGFTQFALDFEKAIGRAEALDALMRAAVVIVADPHLDPLAGVLEAVELGAGEELAPDAFPEALDFPGSGPSETICLFFFGVGGQATPA